MRDPLIGIKLEPRSREYEPGGTLCGEYQIDAVDAAELQAVELSVLWYTEGKGEEDLGVHFFERLTDEDELALPLTDLRRFTTELPKTPLTYEGLIVKLRWCVRVRAFLRRGKDYVAELPFQLGYVPYAQELVDDQSPGPEGKLDAHVADQPE